MGLSYIDYSLNGERKILTMTDTEVSVTSQSIVPKQIVEAGYEVSSNTVVKEFKISVTGVIASGNNGVEPEDYLNELYALRDTKEFFRFVSGDERVLTNSHPRCLLENINRTQNTNFGVVGSFTAYQIKLEITSTRVADLASIVEPDPLYADILLPKANSASTTKTVPETDANLLKKAQSISTNNTRLSRRSTVSLETDVDKIYQQLLVKKQAEDKRAQELAKANSAAARRAL